MLPSILVVSLTFIGCAHGMGTLYPYGAANGDTVEAAGDDTQLFSYAGNFNFYGNKYGEAYINPNGPISFDAPFESFDATDSPKSTAYLAAFWEDLQLDPGKIFHRKVSSGPEVAQAVSDLAAAGHTNPVDHVIIVTWYQVLAWEVPPGSPSNTFQVVLVVGIDCSMFTVFNYLEINWGFGPMVGFNKGNSADITLLTVLDDISTAHTQTNVNTQGRIVTRVDGANLSQTPGPNSCDYVCTSTMAGSVTGYQGGNSQLASGDKPTFTRTQGDQTDPCKFLINVQTDDNGVIEFVAVNVGVHQNVTRHRRSFALGRNNEVVERGQGIMEPQAVTLPHTWSDDDTSVLITGDPTGWTVVSTSGCGYSFTYGPQGSEPVLQAHLSHVYDDIPVIDGACGTT